MYVTTRITLLELFELLATCGITPVIFLARAKIYIHAYEKLHNSY